MSQVLDYSWARPGGANIRSAGYVGVMRYLSHDPTKNLSVGERDELRAAGLDIGLVWEDGAQNALGGQAQGEQDAAVALGLARALGFPDSLPIYFAVDWDTTPEQQAAINAYLAGCAAVIGAPRVGVYGSFYVVERCTQAGTAAYRWQTLAWSGGQVSSTAALYQNGQKVFGGDADVNDVRGSWGGWSAGAQAVPAPGPEPTDPAQHWWGPYVAGADQVVELGSPCHAPVFEAGGTWYRGDTPAQPVVLGEFAQWTLANRVGGVWYVMDETGGPQGAGAQGRLAPADAWWTEDAHVDTTACGGTTPPAVALSGAGRWYAPVSPAPSPPPPPPAPASAPPPAPEPTPPPAPPAPVPAPAPDVTLAIQALRDAQVSVATALRALEVS